MAALWDGLVVNGMRLRNRLALPPLTTNYATPEGGVTERVLRFYTERSEDVGLVIVEATAVRPDGRLVPNSLGLWEESQVIEMERLAGAIKKLGAAAVVQLNHAGARSVPTGGELEGASPSGFRFRPDVKPFTMSAAQIDQVIASFRDAAGRAVDAGFDGVEIHGAHFYLISQFLSPLTNQREDRYGGDIQGRASLALEVIRAVRERVGKSVPLFFRLNAVERVEGGQTLEDALSLSRLLGEDGSLDVLDVSVIAQSAWREVEGRRLLVASSALSKDQPEGANVGYAVKVKEASGLPVIAVGKLGNGRASMKALEEPPVDIVAIGRQMIADPKAARKILSGRHDEIISCKECMNCFATIGRGAPMACTVNSELQGSSL